MAAVFNIQTRVVLIGINKEAIKGCQKVHVLIFNMFVVPGTNLQALIEQTKRPSSSAEIVVVISNRPGVQGLKRASLAGIQTRVMILLVIMIIN